MEDQVKDLSVELDKFMLNSMKTILLSKMDELKNQVKDDDLEKAITYVERITGYTIKLREFDKKIKNNTFNGHFINAEMTIVNLLENIVKDIEYAKELDNNLKLSNLKLNIYESLNQITSIIEKYL